MSRGGSAAVLAKRISEDALPMIDETLDTGSKILWSMHNKESVPVACGWCDHNGELERWLKITSVLAMKATPGWTGYCQKCGAAAGAQNTGGRKLRSSIMKLEDGYVDFDNRDQKKRPWVFCNICQMGRYQQAPYAKGSTGRCRKCQKLIVGDQPHPSGAIVHRSKRDTEDRERVAFTCSNPECCPGCKQDHYVYLAHTLRDEWTGRCADCFKRLPHPHLNTGMEKVGCLDATLDWDDRNASGKPAITCPFSWCEKKWYADISTIANGRRNPKWMACCPEHYRGNAAPLLFLLKGEKRGPGRPPEDRTAEHEQLKARFESVVIKLGQQLPPHKIKRPTIAAEYAIRGESIDQSTITKRVQLLYGEDISVADVVALVLSKNRENNSGN